MSLSDQTTGKSVSKTLQMTNPDTSSAEWIAEAPSIESQGGGYQVLPLANFGKANFTNAAATAGGQTGSISDPNWTVQEVQLSSSGGVPLLGGGWFNPAGSGVGALSAESLTEASPSSLSNGGSSFSVSYSANNRMANADVRSVRRTGSGTLGNGRQHKRAGGAFGGGRRREEGVRPVASGREAGVRALVRRRACRR